MEDAARNLPEVVDCSVLSAAVILMLLNPEC